MKRLRGLDAASRGLEAAYIGSVDLIKIIEYLLANKSTVSKAFEQYEVTEGMCAGWARRTINYSVDKLELNSALDRLAKNTGQILMQKYQVLDVKDIARSASYSAALTKLKKQLDIAHTLQDKDNQLASKDSTIAARDVEIKALKEELLRNKSKDWKPLALTLQQDGVSVTEIAERLGKSRGYVSTFLNRQERLLISP